MVKITELVGGIVNSCQKSLSFQNITFCPCVEVCLVWNRLQINCRDGISRPITPNYLPASLHVRNTEGEREGRERGGERTRRRKKERGRVAREGEVREREGEVKEEDEREKTTGRGGRSKGG